MNSIVTTLALAGAVTGAGLALVWSGLHPVRPALSTLFDELSQPAPTPLPLRRRVDLALAAPLHKLGLPSPRTRQDLDICGRNPAEHLAQLVVAAVAGLLAFGAIPTLWGLPGPLPLWLAVVGAFLTVRTVHGRLRRAANAAREQTRETLAALLDLAGGALAGGAGVEQAIGDTLADLTGPAAARIRTELAAHATGAHRVPTATALRHLAQATGVAELAELATAVEQAAAGAPVAQTMSTVAATLRERSTEAMERAAHARSAQMSLPIMAFGVGYLIFLLYAAMSTISQGLT